MQNNKMASSGEIEGFLDIFVPIGYHNIMEKGKYTKC